MLYQEELNKKKELSQDILARLMSNKLHLHEVVESDKGEGACLPDNEALEIVKESLQDYVEGIDTELRNVVGEREHDLENAREIEEESLSKEQREDLI